MKKHYAYTHIYTMIIALSVTIGVYTVAVNGMPVQNTIHNYFTHCILLKHNTMTVSYVLYNILYTYIL